jgi:membrane-bound serine protease (ClpP class)
MNGVRLRATISAALLAAGMAGFAGAAAAGSSEVVIVPISGTVDDGMAHLVERSVAQANRDDARALVLDIDSGGGLVSSAFDISDALKSAKMPIVAYVDDRAYSAAALIALNAGRIVMGPGASIGAAEPIPYSDKMVSALRGEFESTAQRTHHDPKLAGAMVDKDMTAPYKSAGKVLTLNSADAVSAGLAASSAATLSDALAQSGLQHATQVRTSLTFGETLARFATDPIVSGLLLTLGMLGLLIEMQTLHGIAGTIGVLAFVLFFGTHVYAGFSNGLIIALAVFGVAGILFELHVLPGHGVPGIVGALALGSAIVLSFGTMYFFVALETLASAIVLTVIIYSLLAKSMPENAWIRRLTLAADQGPEYVTSADFTYLRGQSGTATSFLRPAGVAAIGGHRVDVLTEGEFIAAGTAVRVTRVEGARIFVEPVTHGQGDALATRG